MGVLDHNTTILNLVIKLLVFAILTFLLSHLKLDGWNILEVLGVYIVGEIRRDGGRIFALFCTSWELVVRERGRGRELG